MLSGRRGYVVREVAAEEIIQVVQARDAIEGYAARLAAARGRKAADRVAEAITSAAEQDVNAVTGSITANRLIHRAVVEAADNRLLLELFDHLWGRGAANQVYARCFQGESNRTMIRRAHRPIVRAIAAGDADLAQATMIDHLRAGLSEDFLGMIRASGSASSAESAARLAR